VNWALLFHALLNTGLETLLAKDPAHRQMIRGGNTITVHDDRVSKVWIITIREG
jgi:hypothetical protein